MAKKIEEIKEEMGFRKAAPMCSNCKHFSMDQDHIIGWDGRNYPVDKKLRCTLGGFKVCKSNWCMKYEGK